MDFVRLALACELVVCGPAWLILLLSACTGASRSPSDVAPGEVSPTARVRPPEVLPGMVRVPAGPFMMGCAPHDHTCRDGARHFRGEHPYREVWLDSFDIDRLEVTVADYRRCVTAGACTMSEMIHPRCLWGVPGRDDHPINCVRWIDANAYCSWAGKRLASEAEWEKAARGTDGRIYPWGNQLPGPTRANLCDARCAPSWPKFPAVEWDDGHEDIAPVGSYPAGASPYGVLDMIGNVEEWVLDWVEEDEFNHIREMSGAAGRNPTGPPSGRKRALRGANYYLPMLGWERASARNAGAPTDRDSTYGIRCARSVPVHAPNERQDE